MEFYVFWEGPRVPAYIALCLSSWYRQIPELRLHTVNWRNWDSLLGDVLDLGALRQQRFAKQSDCVMAAVMTKLGGTMLDVDTVFLPPSDGTKPSGAGKRPFWEPDPGGRLRGFGTEEWIHLTALTTTRESRLTDIEWWLNDCRERLDTDRAEGWDSMGSWQLNTLYKRPDIRDRFDVWDRNPTMFELCDSNADSDQSMMTRYRHYWCSADSYDPDVLYERIAANPARIVSLHNSWTPDDYAEATIDEVLAGRSNLSELLRYAADVDRAREIEKVGV